MARRLRPGDVFAIDREKGGCFFIIYITRNRFGDAFGICDGRGHAPRVPPGWTPTPSTMPPVYTNATFAQSGRWKHVGHRRDLLSWFPSSPEIYHSKLDNPSNDLIGQYGSAESPSEELRDLSESEAKHIDLDGTYRQIMLEEQFEAYLQHILG